MKTKSFEMCVMGCPEVPEKELLDQVVKIKATLDREQLLINTTETQYQLLLKQRADLRRRIDHGTGRRTEIDELIARFDLLDAHYQSDLARLEGIREAGSLVSVLAPSKCPLCGASSEHQDSTSNCDGNVDLVIAAALAESAKIALLSTELTETVDQLQKEAQSFDRLLPRLMNSLDALDEQIQSQSPDLLQLRSSYMDLVNNRAELQAELGLREQIADLQARRDTLEGVGGRKGSATNSTIGLPSITLDKFSKKVEALLKSWHLPESDRVYFDEKTRDLVIAGKKRGSRGKGLRAITHAAFTIGLLEFCLDNGQPHPGFVVLDSPLLAYREPEGADDDLRGTDVKDEFYNYLARLSDRQVIIIENIDPPEAIVALDSAVLFSKNLDKRRYGLFPLSG